MSLKRLAQLEEGAKWVWGDLSRGWAGLLGRAEVP